MFQRALDKVSKQFLVRERYENFISGNFIGGKWPSGGTLLRQSEPDHREEVLRSSHGFSAI
jgi:hypothetical protein